MCRTASVHLGYTIIFFMTSPDHLKMAPTCGTPVFDIFWKLFIRNYVKIHRKSVFFYQMIAFSYVCVCTTDMIDQIEISCRLTQSNITTIDQNVKKSYAVGDKKRIITLKKGRGNPSNFGTVFIT